MKGRRAGSADIDKAAAFIASEFRKAGLESMDGNQGFLQEFVMYRSSVTEFKYEAEGVALEPGNVAISSTLSEIDIDEKSGYHTTTIAAGENLFQKAFSIIGSGSNTIVYVDTDTTLVKNFPRLVSFLKRPVFKSESTVIFLVLKEQPKTFKLKAKLKFEESNFANVVGMIPGKSRKNEYVIFSGHYDHLGIAREPKDGDSIYNGANDDAAGITAVIMLAKHFKNLNNNERTIIFAAFTAEEIGGFGSQYFSKQLEPDQVVAMFNIEMIGTESKWGKNSAYITGSDKSNMAEILQKNLKGSAFSFYPDPYSKENLFYRSDNATLARLGVPAHTISTAKMEREPNYHQVTDEVSTLDLTNMAEIIRAIAMSSASIIEGADTPSRVKADSLR
jgi:hypothetical protein